jgi:diadenosine tetraphosphate (Ap4A) HIT family hydrolase
VLWDISRDKFLDTAYLKMNNCPFCTLSSNRIINSNEFAVVIRDGFPITDGHTLIIPKRHVGSWFDTSADERTALFALLDQAKNILDHKYKPDSFNIGINDGADAGQTVPHLHIHLIPRYKGDQEDPRGGVRWIIPKKARYWE